MITSDRGQFCTVGFPNTFQRNRIFSYDSLIFRPFRAAEARKVALVIPDSFSGLAIKNHDLEGEHEKPARMNFIVYVDFSTRRF